MFEDFILQCRQNFYDGITPSNRESFDKPGYKKLVALCKDCFKNNGYTAFSDFFVEGQYYISLWAAHLLIELGDPPKELALQALKIIQSHSETPFDKKVATEEKQWLEQNENLISKILFEE